MKSLVPYILYTTSYHEQTGDIITFSQFEEGDLVENECNAEGNESNFSSIDELSTYNDFDDGSISKNNIEDI